jgi:NADH-quinone oxidoreductase subunit I
MQLQPKVFDIDISVCMACGVCAEVCPFDSIKMDQVFNLCTSERVHGLIFHKEQLGKSNSYFQTIHPHEAAEIDEQRVVAKQKAEAKAQAAAKQTAGATP